VIRARVPACVRVHVCMHMRERVCLRAVVYERACACAHVYN